MDIESRKVSYGLTTLELLLGLAVVIVLLAFSRLQPHNQVEIEEMATALERVEACVKAARIASRMYNTDVILHLSRDESSGEFMYYSVPAGQPSPLLLEYSNVGCRVPDSVVVEANQNVVKFNSVGIPDAPAQLLLTSNTNSRLSETFMVQ